MVRERSLFLRMCTLLVLGGFLFSSSVQAAPGDQSKFNLSKTAASVSGWVNAVGDPASGTPTVTDSATNFGFRSTGSSNWNSSFGGENAFNGRGATVDDGGGFAFPAGVVVNYWYNYSDVFVSGKYQAQLFGLDPAKQYTLVLLGSRSNAGGATAPRVTDFNIRGNTVLPVQSLETFQNTSNTVTFTDVQPNSSGVIDIGINKRANGTGGSFAYLNGITVTEEGNTPPTANAGTDKSITLPTSSTSLSGSGTDSDGTIASYAWTFISGPSTPTIVSPTSATTNVTGLSSAGTYTFRLTVTDDAAATATDDIVVTVNGAINQTPSANAGSDQVITLPTSSATLSGSGTDSDGTIASYSWAYISGPATPTIVSPSTASTSVTGMSSAGTYLFRLTVTDNQGATGTDDIQVIANVAPTANAGTDQTISLPTSSVTLSGSGSDTDGTIASYSWATVSAPATPTIVSPSSATTNVTGLSSAGTYTFRLTVTDNRGATGQDTIVVTVNASNASPTANAGSDQTITLPTNTITLSGSGSDSDGTIASYAWVETTSGESRIISPTAASTVITDLAYGTYIFRLTVTDNQGATGTDTVTVTVQPQNTGSCAAKKIVVVGSSTAAGWNASPISNAWVNRYTTYLQGLNASNSVVNLGVAGYTTYHALPTGTEVPANRPNPDTAKNITAAIALNPNAIIVNLPSNDMASGYSVAEMEANLQIISAAADTAGIPIWISTTQPRNLSSGGRANLITVKNWILSTYASRALDFWTTVANSDGTINSVYNSGDGIHLNNAGHQRLYNRVAGSSILTDLCANASPTANAGTDKSITLPTSSTSLTGSGADTDGTIAGYAWTLVSGPAVPTIVSPSASTTSVTGLLSAGTYVFRLTVTDNQGATGTDDIVVTVNAPANQTPSANAGADKVITLPTSSTTVTGSGADTDGTIVGYAWGFVSGPATPTIVSASSSSTSITGMSVSGTYVFRLTVTDDDGATGTDDMQVVANTAPTANAGIDQIISLPTTATTLSGSGSDTDGTIASYAWTFVSGPATPTIISASSAATSVTGLSSAGTYVFRLTVTDNRGATGQDTVSIFVNVPPVISVGIDQSLTLPTSSTTLNGSGTDSDGTIASYAWTFVSGPVTPTISTPASASTDVSGLSSAGTYVFRLTVTDDDGATDAEDIQVVVSGASSGGGGGRSSGSSTSSTVVTPVPTPQPVVPVTPSLPSVNRIRTTALVLNVRSTPEGSLVGKVPTNTQATVISRQTTTTGEWIQVRFDTGLEGWVSAAYTAIIPTESGSATPVPSTSSGNLGRITATNLNVRAAPVSGDVLATLPQGTTLAVLSSVGNWTQVQLPDGRAGWVSNTYFATTASGAGVPTTSTPTGTGRITATNLNVRAAPVSGDVLATLPQGTTLPIISTSNGWTQVQLPNGTAGWVSNTYFSSASAVPRVTPAAPKPTPAPVSTKTSIITGDFVVVSVATANIRSGPSGDLVTTIKKGQEGVVVSVENDWLNVFFSNGVSGYVSPTVVTKR